MHRRYQREEKKEMIPIHQFVGFTGDCTWIHAQPVAMVREVHTPPLVRRIPEGSPTVLYFLGVCSVILKLLRPCLGKF
jgi:hypothetical protein